MGTDWESCRPMDLKTPAAKIIRQYNKSLKALRISRSEISWENKFLKAGTYKARNGFKKMHMGLGNKHAKRRPDST